MALVADIEAEYQSSFVQEICRRLRKARKDSEKTLKDIAVKCGTTAQTIQRLETGNMTVSLEWIEKLCAALDIEPCELFESTNAAQVAKMQREMKNVRDEVIRLQINLRRFLNETHGIEQA